MIENPVYLEKNSLVIEVDPRIELLSIVQYLSDYGREYQCLVTSLDHSFRLDIDKWFSDFNSHPAIKLFNRMSLHDDTDPTAGCFSFDGPPHAMICLNEDLSLNEGILKLDRVMSRAGGIEGIQAFIDVLKEFASESDFSGFYRNHLPFYRRIVKETIDKIENRDIIKELESYYGEQRKDYKVIISPLLGGGCFGPQLEWSDGSKSVYCIMGPSDEINGIPSFRTPESFYHLQWHEFSHSFVNPLTEKHWDICEKFSHLFLPIEEQMKKQAYSSWYCTLNESVIRAATTRLAYRLDGRDAGDKALDKEKSQGFVFTDLLIAKLEEYEQNRNKYPTLDLFYPELIESLGKFSYE